MPKRIQRRRTKGWRMPPNTVYVGRPSIWGNPFEVGGGVTHQMAVSCYALHLRDYWGWVSSETQRAFYPWPVQSTAFKEWLAPLKGRDLCCWCALEGPCHADMLLEIANA